MRFLKSILLAASLFILFSCEEEAGDISISVRHTQVGGEQDSQFVTVTAPEGHVWTLRLVGADGLDVDWAYIDPASGSGSMSSVTLSYGQNDSGKSRTVTIVGKCGEVKYTVDVVQDAYKDDSEEPWTDPTEIQEDRIQPWMELPAMEDSDGLYFITNDMPVGPDKVRNYSYCWDPEALVARWVAYPLNEKLSGSGSRTDAWGDEFSPNIDRKIPRSMQPMLYKGFWSDNGHRYDRGHQCPSADRLTSSSVNATTFRYTNMTPQQSEFNQGIWAALETRVRSWSYSFDTLYVVTGCVVDGSEDYAYDNIGAKVTVPAAYYKALLGYKSNNTIGITGSTHGYTGIAFYFEHRNYSGDNYLNQAMTIKELEKRTGIDFFVNLEAAIGKERYEKVESTRDDWWWKN